MRQLIILFIEFVLIVGLVIGIYYLNLSKKFGYPYKYKKPIMSTRLDLSDTELRKELIFFLTKELGLYEEEFKIIDVIYLYTDQISGADYILVTLQSPDGKLCQLAVSRNLLPYAKWEVDTKTYRVIEPTKPLVSSETKIPQWMQDLEITPEQVEKYYTSHPDVAKKGETVFLDAKTGKYSLPADWYQSVFTLQIEKDKTMRLISNTSKKIKATAVTSYWKVDYPMQYLGPGYREYLYKKIKGER
jgi:hypothetical protein